MLLVAILSVIFQYLLPILFGAFISISEHYRFKKQDKEWHLYKGLFQAVGFIGFGYLLSFQYVFLIVCLFWIGHDIATNLGLRVKWNYLGTTAWTDQVFKYFWIQFAIKIILLITSIFILWRSF